MSMSTHIIFLRDKNDPYYLKMVQAAKALNEVGIGAAPKELATYFGSEDVGEIVGSLLEGPLTINGDHLLLEWNDEFCEGFELDTENIPKGTTTIRFVNCW